MARLRRGPESAQTRAPFPVDGLPILAPDALIERRPDYALLFTWNFADEIVQQQAQYVAAGGKFVVPVPTPRIV
jgi:hypothetical protein